MALVPIELFEIGENDYVTVAEYHIQRYLVALLLSNNRTSKEQMDFLTISTAGVVKTTICVTGKCLSHASRSWYSNSR